MEKKNNAYYAPGKLLITGEYLVLYGAEALAIPVRFGQHLTVNPSDKNTLFWKSYNSQRDTWFSAEFSVPETMLLQTTDSAKAIYLQELLKAAGIEQQLQQGAVVETRLEFSKEWGLGSSSTLTALVAEWLGVDALKLHFKTSNGSGYDVAVASENSSLVYRLIEGAPQVNCVDWTPPFSGNIFFVHLNKKQVSRDEVKDFKARFNPLFNKQKIARVSQITQDILNCSSLSLFNALLHEHENVLAEVLQVAPIHQELFSDYQGGVIKSLGAWGGDFALVTGNSTDEAYFHEKGYSTVVSWEDMVFHPGLVKKQGAFPR